MTDSKPKRLLRTFVVTIDGPAGSGKSTTAREAARRLNMTHVDTGAMYRAVTLRALRDDVATADADLVGVIAETAVIEFSEEPERGRRVWLDGEDVTEAIRTPEVTQNVSEVSAHPQVRHAMVRLQRQLAELGGALLEGRDTGSVVLPWADVKVYLDASPQVRAERRLLEMQGKGIDNMDVERVRADIERRDALDSGRAVSPLRVPVGAVVIDTSVLSIAEQVDAVVHAVEETAQHLSEIWVEKGKNPAHSRPWWWHLNQLLAAVVAHGLWGIKIVRKETREFNENYIYASNHRSNGDPPAVAAIVRRPIYFVAKEALFRNPVFGALIRSYQAIPIKRAGFDRAAMARFSDLLIEGASVLIFPEGGRMKTEELGPPRAGVGYLALRSGAAVVPVYVQGTASPLKSLIRQPRLTIVEGKPIRLGALVAQDVPDRDIARDMGEMVMAAIAALQDEVRHPA